LLANEYEGLGDRDGDETSASSGGGDFGKIGVMVLKIFKIGLMIGGAIGVVIGGAVLGWYLVFNGKVMPGVRVGEVDLGGVAEAEVRRILNVEAVEKLGVVELDYEGRVWKYSEEELGISNKVGGEGRGARTG
jgi:hypothetical protein